MLLSMGYMGLYKNFSPRVASRAKYLSQNPDLRNVIFAPLFCMALFHTNRNRQLLSAGFLLVMTLMVIVIKFIDQPWRGIIDFGVILSLVFGLISLLVFTAQAFQNKLNYPLELPKQ